MCPALGEYGNVGSGEVGRDCIQVREEAVNQVNDARNAAVCGSFDLTAKIFAVGKNETRFSPCQTCVCT